MICERESMGHMVGPEVLSLNRFLGGGTPKRNQWILIGSGEEMAHALSVAAAPIPLEIALKEKIETNP